MANQITGKVLFVGQIQEIPSKSRGNPFRKREIILDASRYDSYTGEKMENYPSFVFTGNRVNDLDTIMVGSSVTISFFISGRKYVKDGTTRCFNEVVGFKIEPFNKGVTSQPTTGKASAVQAETPPAGQTAP